MKELRLLVVITIMLFVSGCASLSESQCQSGDWHGVGQSDGSQGAALSKLAQHQDACGEYAIQIDANAWRQGREQGLRTYCRPLHGYQLGRYSKGYNNVCPDSLVREFNQAYNYGHKINHLEHELVEMHKRLIYEEEAVLDETLSREDRRHHLEDLKQLEIDIERTSALIYRMEQRNPYSR